MKIIIFEFMFLLLSSFAIAQSHVTKSAGYGEEIPSAACLACPGTDWLDPDYITADDGLLAITELNSYGSCFMSTCYYSRYLYAHHFKFNLPPDATIDSILVDIFRGALAENSILDSIVQLEKAGSPVGSNLQSDTLWPKSFRYYTYGHNDPLWGTSWLSKEINDTTFGVTLKIKNISDKVVDAAIDHIRINIYYSTTTGIHSVTSSPSAVEWINSPDEVSVNMYTSFPVNCSSKIYTLSGQEVLSTAYGRSQIGQNHFIFPTADLPDGFYIWEILAGSYTYSRKILIVK